MGQLFTVVGDGKGVSGNNGGNGDEGSTSNDGSSGEEFNFICLPDFVFASCEATGLIFISAT